MFFLHFAISIWLLSSFPSSSDEPLFYRLPLLVRSLGYASASPVFLASGHRRFSPSSALHPQYPPLRQFLSRSPRTITSSSRLAIASPARSQCGCSLGCLPLVVFLFLGCLCGGGLLRPNTIRTFPFTTSSDISAAAVPFYIKMWNHHYLVNVSCSPQLLVDNFLSILQGILIPFFLLIRNPEQVRWYKRYVF